MEAIHARYPFLDPARTAVAEADVDLAALIREDDPAVARSHDRVTTALTEGTIAVDRRVPTRTELLSYPLSRVLISLIDVPGAMDKYAEAEANTAYERIREDCSREDRSITLEAIATDLGLGESIEWPTGDGGHQRIAVERYLELAPDDDSWSLAVRELADGYVTLAREELLALLRRTIERQVRAGLPFDVPPTIEDALAPTVAAIETQLSGVTYPASIERFEPDAFPSCIRSLFERAPSEPLDPIERFALITCCSAVGLDADEIVQRCGRDDEAFVYATERLAGETLPFPPPSFEMLQEAGICTGEHDGYEHPLAAYADSLSDSSAAVSRTE